MDCACDTVQRSDGPSWFIWVSSAVLEVETVPSLTVGDVDAGEEVRGGWEEARGGSGGWEEVKGGREGWEVVRGGCVDADDCTERRVWSGTSVFSFAP